MTQLESNIVVTTLPSPFQSETTCTSCQKRLEGNLARALDGVYHWNCFRCIDCDEPVAEKFFPYDCKDGAQKPLCERDYYKRLDLTCDDCGEALRGSYITAIGKKFHLEHFYCSVCSVVLGPEDSYYEHGDKAYCHYHYSIQHAIKCTGCDTAILKQFVEINRNNIDEHWHPECYMIYKFWNVKLAQTFDDSEEQKEIDLSQMTSNELKEFQAAKEEKVYRIWTVLSAFEESAAGCISDMLLNVSEGNYVECLKMADYFVTHVDVLFSAIDDLATNYYDQLENTLVYERETNMLCGKVSNFFSLLSHTQQIGYRRSGITQDLLTLVTGLAHYLKALIRIGLTGSLRLDKKKDAKTEAVSRFLSKLMELANRKKKIDNIIYSDLCQFCQKVCDDTCYRHENRLWHSMCLACSHCCYPLRDEYEKAYIGSNTSSVACKRCISTITDDSKDVFTQGVKRISKLKQSSFLLRVALQRLYNTLNITDSKNTPYAYLTHEALIEKQPLPNLSRQKIEQKKLDLPQKSQQLLPQEPSKHQKAPPPPPPPLIPQETTSQEQPNEQINLNDIKRMKSTRMNRKVTNSHRIGKRSTLMEVPSPTTASLSNEFEEAKHHQNNSRNIINNRHNPPHSISNTINPNLNQKHQMTEDESCSSSNDIKSNIHQQYESLDGDSSRASFNGRQQHKYTKSVPQAKSFYFSELGTLQHFMLKHIAVLYLEEILRNHFSLEELSDLIDEQKNSSLWSKFVTSLKAGGNKKTPKPKEGTFGVPIDILVDKNGIESNLGVGPTRIIKIPTFIDECVAAMKQMDMSVEGIFRKNGNIRRLKELSDDIDKNPGCIQFINETPIQIAALIKKFLRELPDPLLTFKLHRIFVTAQKLELETDRKRVIHLACCLLPKANRDTMEVLFTFMKWVAQFAEDSEGRGSKMTIENLATVIAPNILYSNSKDPIKDESMDAIETVRILLKNAEDFATVPEDFVPLLQNLSCEEGDMDLNVRHILKKITLLRG